MAQQAPNSTFQRVDVDFKVQGGSRVTWEMARHFRGRAPLNFQLQVGKTGSSTADDWQDVPNAAGTNVFTLSDPDARALGKLLTIHYRVKLVDRDGNLYYSEPATSEGGLSKAEWLDAREIIFRETLYNKKFAATDGYLLKAKRYGVDCTECLDPHTGEVTKSHCTTCKGTRWVGGYYAAIPAIFSQLSENPTRTHRDTQQNRATVHDEVKKGRFIGLPQIYSYDVWVDADSDQRYYIHSVNVLAHLRGVPLVYEVELRQADFKDVIYQVALEGS